MNVLFVDFVTEAVRNNNLEIAQLLLDAGCDINLADRLHHAPIHEAIRQGQNAGCISLLALCVDNIVYVFMFVWLCFGKEYNPVLLVQTLIVQNPNYLLPVLLCCNDWNSFFVCMKPISLHKLLGQRRKTDVFLFSFFK